MNINKEILVRFLNCETTPSEDRAVLEWLSADKKHQKELDELDVVFAASVLSPKMKKYSSPYVNFFGSVAGRIASAVAAVVLVAGLSLLGANFISSKKIAELSANTVTMTVPVGQRVDCTLPDGTSVCLNSGATITYPVAFARDRRDVTLTGEAMFDVAHDSSRPFTVHTFSCSVEALGTKFNVFADDATSTFSTSLIEGKIRVSSKDCAEQVILHPGETASFSGGHISLEATRNRDDFLWTEGIISLDGKSFEVLMKSYGRAYGFNIIYRNDQIPQIRCNGKIRVADGIDHAMEVLRKGGTKFNYEINYNLSEVYIW